MEWCGGRVCVEKQCSEFAGCGNVQCQCKAAAFLPLVSPRVGDGSIAAASGCGSVQQRSTAWTAGQLGAWGGSSSPSRVGGTLDSGSGAGGAFRLPSRGTGQEQGHHDRHTPNQHPTPHSLTIAGVERVEQGAVCAVVHAHVAAPINRHQQQVEAVEHNGGDALTTSLDGIDLKRWQSVTADDKRGHVLAQPERGVGQTGEAPRVQSKHSTCTPATQPRTPSTSKPTCSRILGHTALLHLRRAASISLSRWALRSGSGAVTHGDTLAPCSSRHADDCAHCSTRTKRCDSGCE